MKKALYRAFRPKTFDEVVDQDPIVEVLKNQVQKGNIAHAYLFSGSRGTGKTSCAKIFSRAVNCLNPKNGNPCNECENCRHILEETTMDVVEMDAASNRGVDDIRELREKVQYPPAQLRYKVYIIDEAHMITKEGFNALLKIMEEPPSHLIFILATTEIERIPATILSRTQRYEFKRIGVSALKKQLRKIGELSGISIEEKALLRMAEVSDGAMRDGLSLLDQVIATGETTVTEETLDRLLGSAGELLPDLAKAVLAKDTGGAIRISETILSEGKDARQVLKELILFLRERLIQTGLGEEKTYSVTEVLGVLDILLAGEEMAKRSDFASTLFQMALVKAASRMDLKDLYLRVDALERREVAVVQKKPEKVVAGKAKAVKEEPKVNKAKEIDKKKEITQEKEKEVPALRETFLRLCRERNIIVHEILSQCQGPVKEDRWILYVPKASLFVKNLVEMKLSEIQKVFEEVYDTKETLFCEVGEVKEVQEVPGEKEDPALSKLREVIPEDILKIVE